MLTQLRPYSLLPVLGFILWHYLLIQTPVADLSETRLRFLSFLLQILLVKVPLLRIHLHLLLLLTVILVLNHASDRHGLVFLTTLYQEVVALVLLIWRAVLDDHPSLSHVTTS